MAEIKSAIELAMERTKNLVMDEEEKRQLARKDIEEKLKVVMRRFLEGMTDREQFVADYGAIRADKREKRLLLIDLVIEGFDAAVDNERLFEVLEVLGEDAGGGLGQEAKALKGRFAGELKGRETDIKEGIIARLRSMDISGSAVEPNIAEWREWKDAALETAALLKQRLAEWKSRIVSVPA